MFWNKRKEQEECEQNLKKAKEKIIRDAEIKLMFDIDMIVSNWYYRNLPYGESVCCFWCGNEIKDDQEFFEVLYVHSFYQDEHYYDYDNWKKICNNDSCIFEFKINVLRMYNYPKVIQHNPDGSYKLVKWDKK